MRYSTEDYAKALAGAIAETKPDRAPLVVANFLGLLRKNGEEARGKKIVAAAERLVRGKLGGREVVFESARKLSPAHQQELEKFLRTGDQPVLRLNEGLVAGVRITVDGEYEFDGSLRGKLDKIFAE